MKKISILSLLCMIALLSHAQFNLPNFVAPSPNAYSLGKYGDIPVSLYTGVPNIGVPIYKLVDHEIALDVSLSYHAGGVKIDEEASDVGLSWSLIAGGMITRVVKGFEDEAFPRKEIPMQSVNQYSSEAAFLDQNDIPNAFNGGYDLEPDLFIFNFNGRTGKFSFDKNGNVVLQKREGLEITWQSNGTYGKIFTVRDERGLVYRFNDIETRRSPDFSRAVISTWYLSSITSPTGNTITFQYTSKGPVHHHARAGNNFNILPVINGTVVIAPLVQPQYDGPDPGNQIQELKLTRINSSNGAIDFVYKNTPRLDLVNNPNTSAMDQIIVYDTEGAIVKKVKLTTGYFEANNSRKYNMANVSANQFLNYRLRLEAVQEFSANDVAMQPAYQFNYLGDNNPNTDDVYTLPYRLSPQQDHWGYYNMSNNTHLFPGHMPFSFPVAPWFLYFLREDAISPLVPLTNLVGGANRMLDTAAVKAGMISRVTYPTGGYTNFEFEPNYGANHKIGGLRVKKIKSYPINGLPQESNYTYTYEGWSNIDPEKTYYEYMQAKYQFPNSLSNRPEKEELIMFGLPPENSYHLIQEYLKISVSPQALLGKGGEVGYDRVRVAQPGNGYVDTSFDSGAYYDYDGDEGFTEGVGEIQLLNNVFSSELIFDHPALSYYEGKPVNTSQWPYVDKVDNSWKRGVETSKIYYSEAGLILRTETNEYTRRLLDFVPSFKLFRPNQYLPRMYLFAKSGFSSGTNQLTKSISVQYDRNGLNPVTDTTSYFYDNLTHYQLTRKEVRRSNGQNVTSLTSYPQDYAAGTPFIDNMVSNHLIAYPIEQVSYFENGGVKSLLSGSISIYKLGGKGLKELDKVTEFAGAYPLSSFKFSNRLTNIIPPSGAPAIFAADPVYKNRINYEKYDVTGNVLQLTGQIGDPTVSYIWGYNHQFPIAKAENALVDELAFTNFENKAENMESAARDWRVQTLSPSVFESWFANEGYTGNKSFIGLQIWSKPVPQGNYRLSFRVKGTGTLQINGASYAYNYPAWKYIELSMNTITGVTIQNPNGLYLDDLCLSKPDALVTTYTFKPSTGMTSMTDPKGLSTYYEYDAFQRLALIKDQNHNIVKSYCYNYAGQQTECNIPMPPVYTNGLQSQSFTKNNCSSGETGSTVIYTVAAGKYSSTVSQAAADAQALAEISANGQNYANSNGSCTLVSACRRYRISIPFSESNNLYVQYKPCGSNSYITRSIWQLEQELSGESEVIGLLCTETQTYDISFMYGEYGPSQVINGIIISEIGSCQ